MAASSSSATAFVNKEIAENKVVVFSKTYCPSCTKAKRALDSFKSSGLKYSLVELDTHKDGAAIQGAVGTLTGRRTVPNVFINGKSIGGGDETASAHSSGELKEMLKACGAITA